MVKRSYAHVTGPTGLSALIAAAVITVVLWQIPWGNYVLYPFTILATWFHEMAHGLAALALGGSFSKLLVFSNGSGVAYYSGPLWLEPISRALVAAAGPLGPPIAGAALILASRNAKTASTSLYILAAFLLVSTAIWVRSLFGIVAIPAIGLAILLICRRESLPTRRFAVQFLGVQACVSTYHQVGYLFTYSAGPFGISDTGQMQRILILPYWFWGGSIVIASLFILGQSLRIAYRPPAVRASWNGR